MKKTWKGFIITTKRGALEGYGDMISFFKSRGKAKKYLEGTGDCYRIVAVEIKVCGDCPKKVV